MPKVMTSSQVCKNIRISLGTLDLNQFARAEIFAKHDVENGLQVGEHFMFIADWNRPRLSIRLRICKLLQVSSAIRFVLEQMKAS